jgi:bifunctional UDP-N-acetylglucosamine pyrophosphorylase/glucosamine-1-phosphate N-acetyltransferase
MAKRSSLAIVLAAGEGKRMRSSIPKVLHRVGGLSMVGHVLRTAAEVADSVALVVRSGAHGDTVLAGIGQLVGNAEVFRQDLDDPNERGTARAVLAARAAIEKGADDVLILLSDTPLIRRETLEATLRTLAGTAVSAVVGFEPDDPTGYGRLVTEGDRLTAIVEHNDASPEQRTIRLCNSGIIAFRNENLPALLERIGRDNAKQEYYLTDAIALANEAGKTVKAVRAENPHEVTGVNDRTQLAHAEGLFQEVQREAAMKGGATLIEPDTVHFSYDTVVGEDVTIEPNVFFGPGVTIEDNVTIRAFSHLEGARVASGAVIGPYARLRPGAVIGSKAHIGNFVEIKNAAVDSGAKVNHLTYVGDAHVGAGANVGAGTITCNYDGVDKHHTEIGEGAFIGSNSALVAPVTIGRNAYVASGSVITEDVPDDAMAVARGRQVNKPGWAAKRRAAGKTAKKPGAGAKEA